MRILGIDPGEDIGFSLYDDTRGIDDSWQEHYYTNQHNKLYHMLHGIKPLIIICEDFYHTPRYMKLSMITAELIGVVKLYAQEYEIELVMQNRGMKTGWPAVKIKMLGLWQPGKDKEDAMDALRHRLVYQEKHNMIDWSKLK